MPGQALKADLDELLDHVASGKAVAKACEATNTSTRSFWRRIRNNQDEWDQYTKAKVCAGDVMADKMLAVVEDMLSGGTDTRAAQVAIDTYKWQASKLRPEQYGDRLEHKLTASASLLDALRGIEQRVKDVTPKPAMIEHDDGYDDG